MSRVADAVADSVSWLLFAGVAVHSFLDQVQAVTSTECDEAVAGHSSTAATSGVAWEKAERKIENQRGTEKVETIGGR